jgi:F0F1-type ATP synthase assembly protein I
MKMGRAYQAALEGMVAVVVSSLAGGYADQRLGTGPALLIAGVLLGFGAFVVRLVRLRSEFERGPDAGDE